LLVKTYKEVSGLIVILLINFLNRKDATNLIRIEVCFPKTFYYNCSGTKVMLVRALYKKKLVSGQPNKTCLSVKSHVYLKDLDRVEGSDTFS
jgi:hypothetical protein